MSPTATRRAIGASLLVLFAVGLGVFLAPFAFPTPPPIVTRFQATRAFSPNQDGTREIARIAVRLNEPAFVDVEIRDRSDRRWKGLISEERPAGIVRLSWDGTDDQGRPVPDDRYVVRLRARAGRKRWNASRTTTVDRLAPPIDTLTVASAGLTGPGEGECRTRVTALERGTLVLDVAPAGAPDGEVARLGPRPVGAGQTVEWLWDGRGADGAPVPPGYHQVRATLRDAPGNTSQVVRSCWVGHLIGSAVPARPTLGARVGVRLTDIAGAPLPGTTRVRVTIHRRRGDLSGPGSVGTRVGSLAAGPLQTVRLQLPRRIPPADLVLVATADGGRALIPLRP